MKFLKAILFLFSFIFNTSQNLFAQDLSLKKEKETAYNESKYREEERDKKKKNKKKEIETEHEYEEEDDEYDGPDKAALFEFNKTKDPKTGTVPKERIIKAIEKTKKLKQIALSRNSNSRSVISIWTERGPYTDVVGSSNGNTRPNNGVAAGRVRAVLVDSSDATKKTVWVGGVDGGLWKTTDITTSPANWVLVNDFLSNLAITDICQNPRGTKDTMYFCTGESYYNLDAVKGNGVFKSVDHGITWTQLTSTTSYGYCTRILCDYLGNIYLATRGNGLLRSLDGGNSWTTITPTGLSNRIGDLEISSTGSAARLHVVAGIFTAQAYRYTDIPSTVTSSSGWNTPATSFPSYTQRAEIACKGNVLYALPADATYQVPTIYKSTDGGANWSATSGQPTSGWASGQGWYSLAVDINPNNSNQCIIGGLEPYKTTDGGATWTKIAKWVGTTGQYVHADIHKILWYDGGNKLIFGCDGGIHYSGDGGATIRDRNIGLRIKQFYSCAIHPSTTNFFLAGAQDNGTHLLTGAGLSSSTEVTGGDGAYVAIDQNQPQYQFGSYIYNSYRRSTNTGTNWSSIDFQKGTSANPSDFGGFINAFDYNNANNIIFAGADTGEYFRWTTAQTTSAGTYYSGSGFPTGAAIVSGITALNRGNVTAVHASPYTSNKVYFGTNGSRIIYINRADTATIASSGVNISAAGMSGTVSCINTGTNDSNLIACFSNYGVNNIWVTNNGGTSWTAIDGDLPDMPVRWCMFFPGNNSQAIIATETGVFTTDSIKGSTTVWNASSTFPVVRTDMLKYRSSDGTLLAATHGRGLWTTNISTCTNPIISASSNSPVCVGETLNVSATSNQPTATYSWSGPNNFSSTSLSFTIQNITNAASGSYTLTANYNGCLSTTTINIAVNSGAIVSTSNNSPVCQNQTLNLFGTSNQSTATYSWTGPNNFSSTSLTPSITNVTSAASGTYTLTASYNGCSSTSNTIVSINNSAAPLITTSSNSPVCSGQTLNLSASSSITNATYNWTGPNGFSSTLLSPSISNITTISSGTYTLSGNNNGCINSSSTTVVVNPAGPVTTGATICSGSSGNLSSSSSCSSYVNSGTTITGSWNATTDLTAFIPTNSINNSVSCSFSTITRNYNAINFQVSVTGIYTFEMNNSLLYNAMAYIVSGAYTPGNCNGSGTWIIGDDDGGILGDEPLLSVNLNAGTTYTLISTTNNTTNGTYTGNFGWTITPPSGGQIMLLGTSTINWYTSAIGGTLIGTGNLFNPVGVSGSGLTNTTTPGTTAFYAACSNNPNGCRTATNFTIIGLPSAPIVSITQPSCNVSTGSINVTSDTTGLTFSIDGITYTNTSGIFNGLNPGNYNLTAKNSSGCISGITIVTINSQPPTPSAPTAFISHPTCESITGSINVTSNTTGFLFSLNGTTYTNTSGIFSNLNPDNYPLTAKNSSGCISSASSMIINPIPSTCISTLNLKVYLQGYYIGAGNQKSTLYDLGLSTINNETDSIQINLWGTSSLQHLNPDFSRETILHSDGSATATFPGSTLGKKYYIAIKHRNSIETWSKDSVAISLVTNYDFTNSLNKAFSDGITPPMSLLNDGKYGIYSGDVNQDGSIDIYDMQATENDASNFQYGYFSSDVNGDQGTDLLDMQIIENNSGLFIFYARPN
jgi:hypothetical protein